MSAYFATPTLDTRSTNGLDDVLLTPLTFIREDGTILQAPAGGTTDGLSVPRCVQNIIPATGGDWFSGVLHDAAYRGQLRQFLPEKVSRGHIEGYLPLANYTRKQADSLMLEALKSQRVGFIKRWVIYLALRCFGAAAYRAGHKVTNLQNLP